MTGIRSRVSAALVLILATSLGVTLPAAATDPIVCQTDDLFWESDSGAMREIQDQIDDLNCEVVELYSSQALVIEVPDEQHLVVDGSLIAGGSREVTIRNGAGAQVSFDALLSGSALEIAGTSDVLRVEGLRFIGATTSAISTGTYAANSLTVADSVFENNTAADSGGAIFTLGVLHLEGTNTFSGNVSTTSAGGAIFADQGVDGAGSDLIMRNNTAAYSGGGIHSNHGLVSVHNLTISDCVAQSDNGGGIYSEYVAVTGHSHLEDNSAAGGGAIFTFEDTSVNSVTAIGSRATSSYGGTFYVVGDFTATGHLSSTNSQAASDGGFLFSVGTAAMPSLELDGGLANGDGGGLKSIGNIVIAGAVNITNTHSNSAGGAMAAVGSISLGTLTTNNTSAVDGGGAVESLASSVTVLGDVSITNSHADSGSGGGLASNQAISIQGDYTSIVTSAGDSGGSISSVGSSVTIQGDVDIRQSSSGGFGGGGIYALMGLQADSVLFSETQSSGSGGCIYSPAGQISISEPSTFTGCNSTGGNGGAIAAGGTVTLSSPTFTNSMAQQGHGGAIYVPGFGILTTGTATFTGSDSSQSGGAVSAAGDFTAENLTISNNSSNGDGGAIFLNNGELVVTGHLIANLNASDSYGGAISTSGGVRLNSASVTNNSSVTGGAIFSATGNVNATGHVSFVGNSSTGYGGAISAADIGLATGLFEGNSADTDGGAIFSPSGEVNSTGLVTFRSNSSDGYGGATSASSIDLDTALFEGNSASMDGGAIFSMGNVSVGPGSRFTANTSSGYGGAIVSVEDMVLEGVGFDLNQSALDGGAIFHTGSRLIVLDSSFHGNSTTNGFGGAIAATSVATISNSHFSENSVGGAGSIGGALFTTGDAEIAFSTFQGNLADSDPEFSVSNLYAIGMLVDSQSNEPITASSISDLGGNAFGGTAADFDSELQGLGSGIALQDPVLIENKYSSALGSTSTARDVVSQTQINAARALDGRSDEFKAFLAGFVSDPQVSLDLLANPRAGELFDAGAFEYQLLPLLAISDAELLSDGLTLEITMNLPLAEAFEPGAFLVLADGAGVEFVASPVVASDTTIVLTLAAPLDAGSVVTLNYAGSSVVSEAEPFNSLATVVSQPVTNSSEYQQAPGSFGFSGPIIFVPLSLGLVETGTKVILSGQNLLSIDSITLGGLDAKVNVISDQKLEITIPDLVSGEYNLQVQSSAGLVFVSPAIRVSEQVESVLGFSVIIKRISDTQAKVWAKNAIGQGKIQFMLGGKEIAWVRAVDSSDPKLRLASASYYLVRTVGLVKGKNTIEVFVEGERARRVSYSR